MASSCLRPRIEPRAAIRCQNLPNAGGDRLHRQTIAFRDYQQNSLASSAHQSDRCDDRGNHRGWRIHDEDAYYRRTNHPGRLGRCPGAESRQKGNEHSFASFEDQIRLARSAETEAVAPAISSNFPLPISVAGSGRSRCCRNSPTISAPALTARDRNSSSDSSALNSGTSGAFVATGLLEVSRAACAAAVSGPFRARTDAARRERVRTSRPIRNARSLRERFPSAVGPCPLALLLSKDLLPEDLDFELLNLLGSRRRTWIGSR